MSAHEAFVEFFVDVGADHAYTTSAVTLYPFAIDRPGVPARVREWGSRAQPWAHLTYGDVETGQGIALALPVPVGATGDVWNLLPMVELHTRLISWWLACAWRALELAEAARTIAELDSPLTATVIVRPLLETAAATFDDARSLHGVWQEIKCGGRPTSGDLAMKSWEQLHNALQTIQFGGKFKTPGVQETLGLPDRKNVVTSLSHLDRAVDIDLLGPYEWLCNTVHPSVGNAYLFGTRPKMHASGTHSVREWAMFAGAAGNQSSEYMVQDAIRAAATSALLVMTDVLDASLRFIDDVALTTDCASLAWFEYWRALRPVDRNAPCPCRSGTKAKRCPHDWGASAPVFPKHLALAPSIERAA